MTTEVRFDLRIALDIVDDILIQIAPDVGLEHLPTRMIIIPDNLSKVQLQSYIVKNKNERLLNDVYLTTFEDLAAKITQKSDIMDEELLRLLITASIQKMAEPLAKKLWSIAKKNKPPQDSPVIEYIIQELEEFTSFVGPKQLEEDSLFILKSFEGLDKIHHERAKECFSFFTELVRTCKHYLKELKIEDLYLTRSHLIYDATSKLSQSDLSTKLPRTDIKEIYILGIPIFDNTLLKFMAQLLKNVNLFVIGVTPEIAARTEKRLRAIVSSNDVLFRTLSSDQPIQNVEYYELPDKRRETEFAAVTCLELLGQEHSSTAVNPEDILIVSRLASEYRPYFEPVFNEFGLPAFMRTREALIFSPAYRFIESILNLLVKHEHNQPISATEISQPLRLGFPVSRRPNEGTKWRSLEDRRYLAIETELERIEQYQKKGTIDDWLKKIEKQKTVSSKQKFFLYDPPKKLLTWISATAQNSPSVKPLLQMIKRFIEAYGAEKNYPLLNLVSNPRFEITFEHISAQAKRVEAGLRKIANHYKRVAAARSLLGGEKKAETWNDILRAYRGMVGGTTYGIVQRDADAILFVDAGISHFIDTKHRMILGLTNEQFPRRFPELFLLFNELREFLNRPEEGLFLPSPATQREIEKYLFVSACGRAQSLVLTMNYLDDRGHKQDWSVFVNTKEASKVEAHELRVEFSKILSEANKSNSASASSNISTVLFDVFRKTRYAPLDEVVDRMKRIAKQTDFPKKWRQEITALESNIRAMKTRVLSATFELHLTLGPTDLVQKVFDPNRTPHLWEVDLLTYCPAMYYFYVFYQLFPYRSWIAKKNSVDPLEYIPPFKSSFMGPTPLPIWRMQFSTSSTEWLCKKVGIDRRRITQNEKENLLKEMELLNVSLGEKYAIRNFIEFLADYDCRFNLKRPDHSSLFNNKIVRPLLISPAQRGLRLIAFKLGPVEPFSYTHLASEGTNGSRYRIKHFSGSSKRYKGFDEKWIDLEFTLKMLSTPEEFIQYFVDGSFRENAISNSVCDKCNYRTLCGVWGF